VTALFCCTPFGVDGSRYRLVLIFVRYYIQSLLLVFENVLTQHVLIVDDDEFPPLNANTTDKTEFPFRPFLPRDPPDISSRSETPTLPPGLPLPLGHPAAVLFQDESTPQSPASSVNMPTHPSGLTFSRHGTPLQKSLDALSRRQTPVTKDVPGENSSLDKLRNFGDISLGSPKARSSKKASAEFNHEKSVTGSPLPSYPDGAKDVKKGKPIKLDLSIPSAEQLVASAGKETTGLSATAPFLTFTAGSRPGTPMTGASRNSDSSGTRLPRVLRVVETPKAETPPPPSQVVQPLPSVAQTRVLSRQPSLSSSGRPTSPADGSDYDPTTSASVSRADSPPPTRIGSAPVRAMTKNQVKKERRLKAKQAEEALKEEASVVTNEDTIQAPILGRKRKTKKAPSSEQSATTTTGTAAKSVPESAAPPVSEKENSKSTVGDQNAGQKEKDTAKGEKPTPPAPVAEKEPQDEPWRTENTVSQLIKDIETGGGSVKDLFLERSSPLYLVLAQLHKAGQIDLNTHPLFNPTPLNQRTDMKCTADDYDLLQDPTELTEEARKILEKGLPLRINNGSEALKDRCVITPKGRVLRHLTPEEEERYLSLERCADSETSHEYPALSIAEPDYTNLNGGLAALFATPEKFNIRWVSDSQMPLVTTNTEPEDNDLGDHESKNSPPNALSAMEADATRLHNANDFNGAVGSSAHHALEFDARSPVVETEKQLLEVRGVAFGEIRDIDNIPALDTAELVSYIQQSQRDLEISRKEFDVIDKKFNALVKRNKKIVQQALGTVLEIGK
jgi:CCR4-NOT transcription complex subunit 4